jgi:DNA-binding ferritin-like protein
MPKSVKNRAPKNKTRKSFHTVVSKTALVRRFLEILNTIKLYHWKTQSYSQHKATDEIHEKLSANVDRFVEVLLGKDQSRITMIDKTMKMNDSKNTDDFKDQIFGYRSTIIQLIKQCHKKRDSDLENILAEMLADINQFLYLLSFDK